MAAKLLLLLPLLFARATGSSCAPAAPAAASPAGNWVLTFEDDFDGTALNTSSWTVADRDPTKSQYDGHDAVYLAENIEVANGSLVISTAWAPQTLNGVAYNFSSGWVDTQGKRNQTRGRWEASMRMPAGGNGVGDGPTGAWPAWWLLPGSCWPIGGEVDIIEYYVGEGHFQHSRPDNPPQYSASYHYGARLRCFAAHPAARARRP
jgi:beta-glucanase (GH16 family)